MLCSQIKRVDCYTKIPLKRMENFFSRNLQCIKSLQCTADLFMFNEYLSSHHYYNLIACL